MRVPGSAISVEAASRDAASLFDAGLVHGVMELAAHLPSARGPRVVGIHGPQGCGKSTTAAAVVARARAGGQVAVALSIDDFYLPRTELLALARRHPGNQYLEHRGYPGTHDVALGASTLRALREASPGAVVALPAYDKSAHGGRGDRRPRAEWPRVTAPVDLIVLEGWMLAVPPLAPADLAELTDRPLADALSLLPRYDAWTRQLDAFVQLEASDLAHVVAWRVEAERARRATGAPGLTDDEARDYVERFLPAYELLLPALRARPPAPDGVPIPRLRARLGADRAPIALETSP